MVITEEPIMVITCLVSHVSDLESLSITFHLQIDSYYSVSSGSRLMFLSPVTEFLVFKRMPWVKFHVNVRRQELYEFGDYFDISSDTYMYM